MTCETQRLPGQSLSARKDEVRAAIVRLNTLLGSGQVRVKVGPQGAVVFENWQGADRGRVSDACALRQIMAIGGSLAKSQIAKAEAMAGRTINRQAIAQGVHSHDGGRTWHDHKG